MKYEFLTRPWFAALHGIICEKADNFAKTGEGFRYSICEVFTGVPAHLANTADGKAAWHAFIHGAEVEFGLAERDDTAFKVVVDYVSVIPLSRYDTMGRTDRAAELQSLAAALAADGRLVARGTSPSVEGALGGLHDAIVRLTA